jgi:hypothetical protein
MTVLFGHTLGTHCLYKQRLKGKYASMYCKQLVVAQGLHYTALWALKLCVVRHFRPMAASAARHCAGASFT